MSEEEIDKCNLCDYDMHQCPGCGRPLEHGVVSCKKEDCVSGEEVSDEKYMYCPKDEVHELHVFERGDTELTCPGLSEPANAMGSPVPPEHCVVCTGESTLFKTVDGKRIRMTSKEWCDLMGTCAATIDWDRVFGSDLCLSV